MYTDSILDRLGCASTIDKIRTMRKADKQAIDWQAPNRKRLALMERVKVVYLLQVMNGTFAVAT